MSSITEEQLLDLSAETTAMIASYAAMVVVVKGTKPSARVELYSVKVNALIAAYRAEVVARRATDEEHTDALRELDRAEQGRFDAEQRAEKAESEREGLRKENEELKSALWTSPYNNND